MLIKLDFTLYRPVLPCPKSSPHWSRLGRHFLDPTCTIVGFKYTLLMYPPALSLPFDTEFAGSPAITASPAGMAGRFISAGSSHPHLSKGVLKCHTSVEEFTLRSGQGGTNSLKTRRTYQ